MPDFPTLTAIIGGIFFFIGAIGTALSNKRKTDLDVLRAANQDYKERNAQLETDNERLRKENAALEAQRVLPFEKLITLVTKQHGQQIKSINNLATKLGKVAENIAKDKK